MLKRFRFALPAAAFIALCVVFVLNWPCGSSEWASWIQAFGSIAAIYWAAKLADQARQDAEASRRTAELFKEKKAIERVREAVRMSEQPLRFIVSMLNVNDPPPTPAVIGKIRTCLPMLEKSLDALDEAADIWVVGMTLLQQLHEVCQQAQALHDLEARHPGLQRERTMPPSDLAQSYQSTLRGTMASVSLANSSTAQIHARINAFFEQNSLKS